MATKGVMQVQLQGGDDHHHQRTNKFSGHQKKEELEREVAVLRKMLEHEEKVHEFLERVQHPQGSNVAIPNFLPSKMKEVVAELSMVENEISRLESEIRQLQADHMKLQKGTTKGPDIVEAKEKVAFETKALHFISKAIKGDYNISDFSAGEKVMKPKIPVPLPKKSGHFDQEDGAIHKSFRRSGGAAVLKPSSSPMREPRHSTPRRDRNLEIISEQLPPKAAISAPQTASEEDNFHKWSPNKLSENLLKCLLLIFVRLLRTSRTMELEKSGPISRSTNFSLSFRAEPSLSSLHAAHKDSRQQDPYGIFDSEESITRDIGPYKNLIRFTATPMDPKCISTSSSLPLFQKLRMLVKNLQKVELRYMTHHQKLAFWINMYNACIMHAFLQNGVPSNSNPEELLMLLNQATLNVGGTTITAQTIEHTILRKPTSSLIKEMAEKGSNGDSESNKAMRERFGVEPFEPNVTFGLCCGTRSSPAVKIYTGEGVVAELEKSKLEYLQASIMVMSRRRIAIPEHLLMHIYDFAEDVESLMEWVCHQLPTSGSLRKSIVDCFRGIPIGKASTIIDKIPYDFEFQYLMVM